MLKVQIKTENEAFSDDKGAEVARILREIAKRLEDGWTTGTPRDGNGNSVGTWLLK